MDVLEEPPNVFSLNIAISTVEILGIYDNRFCRDVALVCESVNLHLYIVLLR